MPDRLTDDSWRNLDPWECCGQDNYCQRGCHEEGGCANGCIVPKIYRKLAQYEDAEEAKIPQEPIWKETFWAYKDIRCPNCNSHICFSMPGDVPKDINFCVKCGQALDWGKKE